MKVKYKGEYIVDSSDKTKKLLTKGSFCEDDIEIEASGGGGSTIVAELGDSSLQVGDRVMVTFIVDELKDYLAYPVNNYQGEPYSTGIIESFNEDGTANIMVIEPPVETVTFNTIDSEDYYSNIKIVAGGRYE